MGTSISVTEARAVLAELVGRVLDGEEITLTRHGQPVAVMVRPDRLRNPRTAEVSAAADRLLAELRAARGRPMTGPGVSRELGERWIRELREERDSRP